jgi:hypothetical protein
MHIYEQIIVMERYPFLVHRLKDNSFTHMTFETFDSTLPVNARPPACALNDRLIAELNYLSNAARPFASYYNEPDSPSLTSTMFEMMTTANISAGPFNSSHDVAHEFFSALGWPNNRLELKLLTGRFTAHGYNKHEFDGIRDVAFGGVCDIMRDVCDNPFDQYKLPDYFDDNTCTICRFTAKSAPEKQEHAKTCSYIVTPTVRELAIAAMCERTPQPCRAPGGCRDDESCVGCADGVLPDFTLDPFVLNQVADALLENGLKEEVSAIRQCGICSGTGFTVRRRSRFDAAGEPVSCTFCNQTGRREYILEDRLIAHLRSPKPHVLGCWALDLITGRQSAYGD